LYENLRKIDNENSVVPAQHLLMEQTVYSRTKECYTLVSEIAGIDIRNESEFMACFVIDAGIRNKLESIINRNNDFSVSQIL